MVTLQSAGKASYFKGDSILEYLQSSPTTPPAVLARPREVKVVAQMPVLTNPPNPLSDRCFAAEVECQHYEQQQIEIDLMLEKCRLPLLIFGVVFWGNIGQNRTVGR